MKRSEPVKQRAFLSAYAQSCSVTFAARSARIARATHYRWLADEAYGKRFEEAKVEAVEALELELRRRALHGVERPVLYQGKICYDDKGRPLIIREYSDLLGMFLLKAAKPKIYRDNATIAHTGEGGGPIEVNVRFVAANPS